MSGPRLPFKAARSPLWARLTQAGAAMAMLGALLPSLRAAPAVADGSGATVVTQTATRTNLISSSTGPTTQTVDSRAISLSVSDTQNLRGFQQVTVSWSGAHPTGGGGIDINNGDQGAYLEYPMVLLECRGVDDPTAPTAQQLTPSTCWTAYNDADRAASANGPDVTGGTGFPPWRLDMYATQANREPVVNVTNPASSPAGCPPYTIAAAEYWQPFVAASGATYYPGPYCYFPPPPEAIQQFGATLSVPSNETFGITTPAGVGSTKFDVLTVNENASLGCSDTVPCSLVAIPIMGISCDLTGSGPPENVPPTTQTVLGSNPPVTIAQQADAGCTNLGQLGPASTVGAQYGAQSDYGQLWWAASNWRNRMTVPLSFAPTTDPCAGGSHQEVDVYGSELMTEAAAQWDPHFCSDSSLFTLKDIAGPDREARNLLSQGNIEAAYAGLAPTGTYQSPVVKAPVAVSGFAISFNIDDYNGNPVSTLRLDPRLLAKLLTESYTADSPEVIQGDPGLATNPESILADPEFLALNPIFTVNANTTLAKNRATLAAAATLYSLSSDSDTVYALTSYIIDDPEARAWLFGQPDPWGMTVNPNYNLSKPATQIALPTDAWRLLDSFVYPATDSHVSAVGSACPPLATDPFLGLVASPSAIMYKVAQAVEFGTPLSTENCIQVLNQQETQLGLTVGVLSRDSRQSPGERFILGVTSLGQASRYDLSTAALQTAVAPGTPAAQFPPAASRTFVAPSDASLRAAAAFVQPDPATGTWQFSVSAADASPAGAGAYPGTQVISLQAPTSGLPAQDATNISKVMTFAAGPGQTPGTGRGQLPPGYLPMTSANGLGQLALYTQAAAVAVAAQKGDSPPLFPGAPSSSGVSSSSGSSSQASKGGSGSISSAEEAAKGAQPGSSPGSSGSGTTTTAGASSAPGGSAGSAGGAGFSTSAPGGTAATAPLPVPASQTTLVGKTIGILAGVADSLLHWLFYLALLCAVAGAAIYLVGRRRGLDLANMLALLRERLGSIRLRRGSP